MAAAAVAPVPAWLPACSVEFEQIAPEVRFETVADQTGDAFLGVRLGLKIPLCALMEALAKVQVRLGGDRVATLGASEERVASSMWTVSEGSVFQADVVTSDWSVASGCAGSIVGFSSDGGSGNAPAETSEDFAVADAQSEVVVKNTFLTIEPAARRALPLQRTVTAPPASVALSGCGLVEGDHYQHADRREETQKVEEEQEEEENKERQETEEVVEADNAFVANTLMPNFSADQKGRRRTQPGSPSDSHAWGQPAILSRTSTWDMYTYEHNDPQTWLLPATTETGTPAVVPSAMMASMESVQPPPKFSSWCAWPSSECAPQAQTAGGLFACEEHSVVQHEVTVGGDKEQGGSADCGLSLSSKPLVPPVLERSFSRNTGHTVVCWNVNGRKFTSNNTHAQVSPTFEVTLGKSFPSVPFKIMIRPKVISERKGGASFRTSKGRGSVELVCEKSLPDTVPDVEFWVSIGAGKSTQGPRGPISHNFAESAVSRFPRDQAEWEFRKAVDQERMMCPVRLEISPIREEEMLSAREDEHNEVEEDFETDDETLTDGERDAPTTMPALGHRW
eukprot:TRINITY_DN31121_c0_g1_i1.p1 TRINITY_DN31121_c0_g1~~TRINITY_DN31121_c0_g1_i1.p1  ORF type:complete len:565 (-),score=95.21 TRINITY_DN31121_c0_g1_i1:60-1754(-)